MFVSDLAFKDDDSACGGLGSRVWLDGVLSQSEQFLTSCDRRNKDDFIAVFEPIRVGDKLPIYGKPYESWSQGQVVLCLGFVKESSYGHRRSGIVLFRQSTLLSKDRKIS